MHRRQEPIRGFVCFILSTLLVRHCMEGEHWMCLPKRPRLRENLHNYPKGQTKYLKVKQGKYLERLIMMYNSE